MNAPRGPSWQAGEPQCRDSQQICLGAGLPGKPLAGAEVAVRDAGGDDGVGRGTGLKQTDPYN
jgi:hypothetical protein